jgi:hypothetical protein
VCLQIAVIQKRYVVSPDNEFKPKGKTSKIKYLEGFCKYSQLADKLLSTPHGKKTFDMWDRYIFEGIDDLTLEPEEEDGDFDEMMDDLDADAALDEELERLEGDEDEMGYEAPSVGAREGAFAIFDGEEFVGGQPQRERVLAEGEPDLWNPL